MTIEGDLREKAKEMGMHLIGFSAIEKTSYAEIVRSRISQGLIPEEIVELTECFQVPDVFADPTRSLAGAKTLICVGQSYLERKSAPRTCP